MLFMELPFFDDDCARGGVVGGGGDVLDCDGVVGGGVVGGGVLCDGDLGGDA